MHASRIFAAGLSAVLTLAAPAAFAQPAPDDGAPRIAVPYGDLDLATAHGRHQLDRRIARAADAVCQNMLSIPDHLTGQMDYDHCRDAAMAKVDEQLAARGLTYRLAAKDGTSSL